MFLLAAASAMIQIAATPSALTSDKHIKVVVSDSARDAISGASGEVARCFQGEREQTRQVVRVCLTEAEWLRLSESIGDGRSSAPKYLSGRPDYTRGAFSGVGGGSSLAFPKGF